MGQAAHTRRAGTAKRAPNHLRDALGELLTAGYVSPSVRPEIAASWDRSIASDLSPDHFDVPYEPDVAENDRLRSAALPVARHLIDDLASTSMSLLLADKHGHVVERFVGDGRLRSHLDGIMLAPGFVYREDRIGTNAIGTALEQAAPCIVVGSEHFADALTGMACAAAPILDPHTGSVLGAIDLTCSERDSHSLMIALARHAAREIEQQLVSGNPEADRLLLEGFVRARRHTRAPLVGLSGQAMYTNTRAARILRGEDRVWLWELVAAALVNRRTAQLDLPLRDEVATSVACEAILDGAELVGALVRFQPDRPTHEDPVDRGHERTSRPIFGWDSLTENQLGLAGLIAEGLSNREAAARLFLSRHTIDFHLRQIYQKLGIHSRVELARIVIERGDAIV